MGVYNNSKSVQDLTIYQIKNIIIIIQQLNIKDMHCMKQKDGIMMVMMFLIQVNRGMFVVENIIVVYLLEYFIISHIMAAMYIIPYAM